jgi:uncharacterized protein (TIGR02466 family)
MERNINATFTEAFAIPLGVFNLENLPEIDLAKEIIKEYTATDHLLVPGGKSSWASYTISILHDPRLINLKEHIDEAAEFYAERLGLSKIIMSNSWFNIMPKGSTVVPHRHERSTISGAVYIDSDEGASPLYFTNPTTLYRMAEEITDHNTMYTSKAIAIQSLKGRCILFPSWLEHGTETNEYDGRTVISFNYMNYSNTQYKFA